jgi:hypothetical protein
MLYYSDIWSVTVIVPVLKSVARKQIRKTMQRISHCLDLLPCNDFCKQIYEILFMCYNYSNLESVIIICSYDQ